VFEQSRLTRRRAAPLSLLIGGALTLLGYYGLPWWAGWPAYAVLAYGESAWTLSERGVTWQVAFFAAAVLVNVLCWAALVRLVLNYYFRKRRGARGFCSGILRSCFNHLGCGRSPR
jgi:membrane protein implicated in regulation of membrane protease activity